MPNGAFTAQWIPSSGPYGIPSEPNARVTFPSRISRYGLLPAVLSNPSRRSYIPPGRDHWPMKFGWHTATTPSRAIRSTCSGWRSSACSIRWRGPGSGATASIVSRTSGIPRAPIPGTPARKPPPRDPTTGAPPPPRGGGPGGPPPDPLAPPEPKPFVPEPAREARPGEVREQRIAGQKVRPQRKPAALPRDLVRANLVLPAHGVDAPAAEG